jgi:signal transduction histidine kinase
LRPARDDTWTPAAYARRVATHVTEERSARRLEVVRRRPADVALALAVGAVQIVPTYFMGRHQPGSRSLDLLGFVLLGAGPVALVVRRRFPGTVHVVVFTTTLLYAQVFGYPRGPIFLGLIVSFVTAVLAGRRVIAWGSLALGYFGFLWLGYLLGNEPAPSLAPSLALAAWLLVLLTAAEVLRMRRERALGAARTREEEARRRVTDERLRIARELHDVLAHNISLINVQAGVALHLIDERPEQARTALATIKDASKEALGELRSVLGVLRQVDEGSPRRPTPSLARLDDLVANTEAAGLTVRTQIEGDRRPLPAGVDLAAFRIAQEALTNAARHAGRATATVRVTYRPTDLTVLIEDDGRGTAAATSPGGGSGIPGMRERVEALGGEFEAGPRPEGGFRVRAQLPLEAPG